LLVIRKVPKLAALSLALLPLLLVRAMRPLVLVRFAFLPANRIGMLAAIPDLYLCERESGQGSRRTIDFFHAGSFICNRQLLKMWTRTLHITGLVKWLDQLNRRLPGGKQHQGPSRLDQRWDNQKFLEGKEAHVRFTAHEEAQGSAAIRQLGVPEGTQFVCFHARDSAYGDSLPQAPNSSIKLPPRSQDFRNCSILDQVPALEEMARRGYYSIRMGAVVKEPLGLAGPQIIDYAFNGRTDLLDLYLASKCRFFVCASSGIDKLPMLFRRPCVHVNYVPLRKIPNWRSNDLSILKKLWLTAEQRYLTFQEIIDSELGWAEFGPQYDQLGIELVDNTPEEITAAVTEMDDRLAGTWQTTQEDEDLQSRFWSLLERVENGEVFRSRIGTQFLRENRGLLD